MARQAADRGPALTGASVARYHRALQSVREPRAKPVARRTVIMKIFMQGRGDRVLDSSSNRVARESRAEAFGESGRASAVVVRMVQSLADCRPGDHPRYGSFPEHGMFPMLPVRMRLLPPGNNGGLG